MQFEGWVSWVSSTGLPFSFWDSDEQKQVVRQVLYKDCRSPFEIHNAKRNGRKPLFQQLLKLPFSFWDSCINYSWCGENQKTHKLPFSFWDSQSTGDVDELLCQRERELPFSFWDSYVKCSYICGAMYFNCRSPFEILESTIVFLRKRSDCRSPFEILSWNIKLGGDMVGNVYLLPFSFWDSY